MTINLADGNTMLAATHLRPRWIDVDDSAIGHNLGVLRSRIGFKTKVYFVCKGDGFGFGATHVAKLAADAGVDGFCAGSPEEVVSIRAADPDRPIILFGCHRPQDLAEILDLECFPTLHNLKLIETATQLDRNVSAYIEFDAGLSRYGLLEHELDRAKELLAAAPHVRILGVYAHLTGAGGANVLKDQQTLYERMCLSIGENLAPFERMVASSRVLAGDCSGLIYDAVDPGRFLYGIALPEDMMAAVGLNSMIREIGAEITQITSLPAGAEIGVGYGDPIRLDYPSRIATIPIGVWDGLNLNGHLGSILVGGTRASVLKRTFQHTMIDVTNKQAELGSVVLLVGRQGEQSISSETLCSSLSLSSSELLPRLLRCLPRRQAHTCNMD